jgi:RNA polymerase sigma factor (sigma-70 family)
MSDPELLHHFAHLGSQEAFATLVQRHIDLVYSAARRQVRSPELAEEVAQSVFLDLARSARNLKPETPLVAWLFVVTRRTAIDALRRETRRHTHERAAAEIAAMSSEPPAWSHIEPLLDEAMATLPEAERTAILLRFFQNKSLREVGATLGASENAAQKRVSRALEQMRAFFLRRGVAISASGLMTVLSAPVLEAAPAGLSAAISSHAAIGAAVATGAHTVKFFAMTALQKTALVGAVALIGGAALYEANLAARQSSELERLNGEVRNAEVTLRETQTRELAANGRLETVEKEIDRRLAVAVTESPADAVLETQIRQWLDRIDRLKALVAARPELSVPELQLLTPDDWFAAGSQADLDSEEAVRNAFGRLRNRSEGKAAGRISEALKAYVRAHDGMLPADATELAPYFEPPIDPAILARYEMRRTGNIADVTEAQAMKLMGLKKVVDAETDTNWFIGTTGYGNSGNVLSTEIREAQTRFGKANNGQRATTAEQLMPYLKSPARIEAVRRIVQPGAHPTSP